MTDYGWDLPPGCTEKHLDDAWGDGPDEDAEYWKEWEADTALEEELEKRGHDD